MGSDIDGAMINERFGRTLAISDLGTTLAIGGERSSIADTTWAGVVRVYEYSGSAWSQLGDDLLGDTKQDYFGCSVALSGDGLVVAAGYVGYGTKQGAVKVYELSGTTWNQRDADSEGYTDPLSGDSDKDRFGSAVALSVDGSVLAVGAPMDDDDATNGGTVKVYSWSASTTPGYSLMGAMIKPRGFSDRVTDNNAYCGQAISLSADGLTLAIGCPRADLKVNGVTPMMGEVHIYEYSSGAWALSATLYDETSDGIVQDGSRFGEAVSLSADGTIVAVGAWSFDDATAGDNAGRVTVYYKGVDGTWATDLLTLTGGAADDIARRSGTPGARLRRRRRAQRRRHHRRRRRAGRRHTSDRRGLGGGVHDGVHGAAAEPAAGAGAYAAAAYAAAANAAAAYAAADTAAGPAAPPRRRRRRWATSRRRRRRPSRRALQPRLLRRRARRAAAAVAAAVAQSAVARQPGRTPGGLHEAGGGRSRSGGLGLTFGVYCRNFRVGWATVESEHARLRIRETHRYRVRMGLRETHRYRRRRLRRPHGPMLHRPEGRGRRRAHRLRRQRAERLAPRRRRCRRRRRWRRRGLLLAARALPRRAEHPGEGGALRSPLADDGRGGERGGGARTAAPAAPPRGTSVGVPRSRSPPWSPPAAAPSPATPLAS